MSRSKRPPLIHRQPIQPPIFSFLLLDIFANHLLVATTVETKDPRAQKCCPTKFRDRSANARAMWIARFPLR